MAGPAVKVTITPQDILDLEEAMAALYRAQANAEAIKLGALALRFRGEILATFNCNVDESAGLAEVVELNGWSRKVPCE